FEDPRSARSDLSCENGLSVQRDVRQHIPRSLRAAAARCHGRGPDAVHAARHGRGVVALGDANPRALGRGRDGAAADVSGRRVGTDRGRSADYRNGTPMEKPVVTRVSHACSPAVIEDELAVLWRDAGRDGPVARALMANLVVYRERHAKETVDL